MEGERTGNGVTGRRWVTRAQADRSLRTQRSQAAASVLHVGPGGVSGSPAPAVHARLRRWEPRSAAPVSICSHRGSASRQTTWACSGHGRELRCGCGSLPCRTDAPPEAVELSARASMGKADQFSSHTVSESLSGFTSFETASGNIVSLQHVVQLSQVARKAIEMTSPCTGHGGCAPLVSSVGQTRPQEHLGGHCVPVTWDTPGCPYTFAGSLLTDAAQRLPSDSSSTHAPRQAPAGAHLRLQRDH